MIVIKQELCTGCGACLKLCPHGALYLLEGKAVVDEALCRECEACVAACPEQAIVITEAAAQSAAPPAAVPTVRPQPQVIRVKTEPAPVAVPWRARMLPVIGAAVAWARREVVPCLVDCFFNHLARRTAGPRRPELAPGSAGAGSQHRRGEGRRRRRRRGD